MLVKTNNNNKNKLVTFHFRIYAQIEIKLFCGLVKYTKNNHFINK